jgi:hypothetical protein
LDTFGDAMREVIEPMHVQGIGIRVTSELGWITADLGTR